MTDVAGPPEPAGRLLSSLPIFGPAAAREADGSELRVDCDMAQTIGTGVRYSLWETDSGQQTLAHWSSQTSFQIAIPSRARPYEGRQLGIWVSHRVPASGA